MNAGLGLNADRSGKTAASAGLPDRWLILEL
jgi:hypothetical protein